MGVGNKALEYSLLSVAPVVKTEVQKHQKYQLYTVKIRYVIEVINTIACCFAKMSFQIKLKF